MIVKDTFSKDEMKAMHTYNIVVEPVEYGEFNIVSKWRIVKNRYGLTGAIIDGQEILKLEITHQTTVYKLSKPIR